MTKIVTKQKLKGIANKIYLILLKDENQAIDPIIQQVMGDYSEYEKDFVYMQIVMKTLKAKKIEEQK